MSIGVGRCTPHWQPSNYHTIFNHSFRDEVGYDTRAQVKLKCPSCGVWGYKGTRCRLCNCLIPGVPAAVAYEHNNTDRRSTSGNGMKMMRSRTPPSTRNNNAGQPPSGLTPTTTTTTASSGFRRNEEGRPSALRQTCANVAPSSSSSSCYFDKNKNPINVPNTDSNNYDCDIGVSGDCRTTTNTYTNSSMRVMCGSDTSRSTSSASTRQQQQQQRHQKASATGNNNKSGTAVKRVKCAYCGIWVKLGAICSLCRTVSSTTTTPPPSMTMMGENVSSTSIF